MSELFARWLAPDWPAPASVRAIVVTREGPEPSARSPCGFNVGTRCGDEPERVARNRAFLRDVLQLPAEPCWLQQVHGTRAVTLDAPLQHDGAPMAHAGSGPGEHAIGREPQADAAVTRAPGVVLAIQTADCLPVLLAADDGSEIAAAHAGWRGLSAGVLEATLAAMRTPHSNVIAWLGPAIAAGSYEVGEEVRDAFLRHDAGAASAFGATRAGHWSCDLYELARQRLRAAGVSCIAGGGFDTFSDPRLHSYRRDGACSGRMASLIWIAA